MSVEVNEGTSVSTTDSILNSIKKKLGLDADYTAFDEQIIISINAAFYILYQLGIGDDPSMPFRITDSTAVWSDFITDGKMEICKDDIYFRVRLAFDPPTNSFLVENIKKQIEEYEWRMSVGVEEPYS